MRVLYISLQKQIKEVVVTLVADKLPRLWLCLVHFTDCKRKLGRKLLRLPCRTLQRKLPYTRILQRKLPFLHQNFVEETSLHQKTQSILAVLWNEATNFPHDVCMCASYFVCVTSMMCACVLDTLCYQHDVYMCTRHLVCVTSMMCVCVLATLSVLLA